jgi:hypothetical protein
MLLNDILQWFHGDDERMRLDDDALAFAVEVQFGERIFEEVCKPHGADRGECLPVIVSLLREDLRQPRTWKRPSDPPPWRKGAG